MIVPIIETSIVFHCHVWWAFGINVFHWQGWVANVLYWTYIYSIYIYIYIIIFIYIWKFPDTGHPVLLILAGFSLINHPVWGTPHFRKPPYVENTSRLGQKNSPKVTSRFKTTFKMETLLDASQVPLVYDASQTNIPNDICSAHHYMLATPARPSPSHHVPVEDSHTGGCLHIIPFIVIILVFDFPLQISQPAKSLTQ